MASHGKITEFKISGLFGHDPAVDFTPNSAVTILTGPNGSGKTHTLKLLRALLAMDFAELFTHPYQDLYLKFGDGSFIKASRKTTGDNLQVLNWVVKEKRKRQVAFQIDSEGFDIPDESDSTPRSTRGGERTRVSVDGTFYYVDADRDKIRERSERKRRQVLGTYPVLQLIVNEYPTTFIDTKRLDTYVPPAGRDDSFRYIEPRSDQGVIGRMREYVTEIRLQITEARRESLKRSQEADERFASNLLNRSRQTVQYAPLVRRYERLSRLSDELSQNGLAGKAINVEIPAQANPTEKRTLDLFLQDWESKLEPLLPIHTKLTALTRIVNNKFVGKYLQFDQRGYVRFWAKKDNSEIRVDQLSSGEQHLLALFTRLLFSAEQGSTVLIDEPEISLHAAWKHAFIEDIEEVAEIADLTVVMATHSTAIINGRWELVQELGDVDETA